jgi:hypothetical protein
MDLYLLLPKEAAALINVPCESLVAMIAAGRLGAFRNSGEWWIPLKCLTQLASDEFDVGPAEALEQLVSTKENPLQSLSDEAAERIETSDFPPGSVGLCLQQAMLMFRRHQAGTDDLH